MDRLMFVHNILDLCPSVAMRRVTERPVEGLPHLYAEPGIRW